MKICKTEQEYISAIAGAVQKCCKRYGYLPSVLIAQSCLENGYGIRDYWDNPQIEALLTYNNMVGIKSELLSSSWSDKTVWPGKSLTKQTPETYNGKNVTITDNFRIYDNIDQSFADFLLFLTYASNNGKDGTPKYGQAVMSIKDPEKLIKAVHERGYATGPTYATNVMKIVNKHGLTKYDDLSKTEQTIYAPGYKGTVAEEKKTAKTIKLVDRKINDITARNKSHVPASRGSNKVQFIVIHYLGVPNADNPDLYSSGNTDGYGGHYNITRAGTIYKAADPKTAVVWHCGGGLQGSGGHEFFGKCSNYNSIGIENGVCYTENVKDGDGDSNKWYFTEETQESLVYLVSKLMDEYGISIDHVIRHYDVTGKICPNPYVKNNHLRTSWTWTEFKNNVLQFRKDGTITIPDGSTASEMPAQETTTRSYLQKGDTGSEVKTMQTMLIACGYSCGSAGADGDFGANTLAAVKAFQNAYGLTVDGLYGAKTKAQLESAYKSRQSTDNGTNKFLEAVSKVAAQAKSEEWIYGDSHAMPPCSDKKISCDRLIARALYDLGYKDQPQGGTTINLGIDAYLQKCGFTKVAAKSQIKAGAVVAVGQNGKMNHVFVVESYNSSTDLCRKYDTGSDARIKKGAYYANVKLVEWTDRVFICAWNPPANLSGSNSETKTESTTISGTTMNGVNYTPVYTYSYYRKKYADLRKAFGNDKAAYFNHFCTYGMKECRQASSKFNVKKYRNRYTDLQKAFGDNWPEYYKHYCIFGKKEGRKAT